MELSAGVDREISTEVSVASVKGSIGPLKH